MSILPQVLDRLTALLLPQDCLLCRAPSGEALLCPACADELPQLPGARCPRCANASPGGEICGRCQRHPPTYDRLIALYPYAAPLDRMVQQLKYGHQLALATWFGKRLADACRDSGADLVMPMPLHPSRLAERGFNQSQEIARHTAAALALELDAQSCFRTRDTPPQAGLSLRERRRNVRNAFACRGDLQGRRILLIDDVVTTGSTVGECARTLYLHGAGEVVVGAVAHTLRE